MVQANLFGEEKPIVPYPKSLVKSAIQKQVRRGNVDAALRLTKAHIEMDAHDFARRVFVIVPEEVSIHPLLVKMPEMITRLQKKAAKATDEDKSIMLTLIRDAAKATHRDFYLHNPDDQPIISADQLNWLNEERKEMIRAIQYRASIGGMKSDIAMFNSLYRIWVTRWSGGEITSYKDYFNSLDEPMVKMEDIELPTDEDIPYYAADFHCFPPGADMILFRRSWQNGEKVKTATPVYDFIQNRMSGVYVRPRPGDSREIEIVKKTMWLYEAARSSKINLWAGRTVDWWIEGDQKQPSEYRDVFDELNEFMAPYWADVASWYVSKSHDK